MATAFDICHQVGNAWQFLDVSDIVAVCDDAFFVDVDDVIPHHLATAYFA